MYRPHTLADAAAEVARALASGGDPLIPIRDFVDDYRRTASAARPRLSQQEPRLTGDVRFDAYLAAMAEHFALQEGYPPPEWVEGQGRFLHRAWFREPREGFWPMALVQTPPAFRRRLVFIEESEFERV